MAYVYEIKPNTSDSHQVSNWALTLVVRLRYRNSFNPGVIGDSLKTFNAEGNRLDQISAQRVGNFVIPEEAPDSFFQNFRTTVLSPKQPDNFVALPEQLTGSISDARNNPVAELDPVLLSSEIAYVQVGNDKSNHLKSMGMKLIDIGSNLLKDVAPGDWVMTWLFNNEDDFLRVKNLVQNQQPANDFRDGLKFVGRVKSMKRDRQRNTQLGRFKTNYTMTAMAFTELDAQLYFNEILRTRYAPESLEFMQDLGSAANDFIYNSSGKNGGITASDAIPKLLNICLGLGPNALSKNLNEVVVSSSEANSTLRYLAHTLEASPNVAYRVPESIGKYLGIDPNNQYSKEVGLSYNDVLHKSIGIQRYEGGSLTGSQDQTGDFAWKGFIPVGYELLTGEFRPTALNFDKTTVWSLIHTYLNEPINEMYTALRVCADGKIRPSLVARQLPLSSNLFASKTHEATAFTSVPRWRISEQLVVGDFFGTSDALRTNFVHLMGQDTTNPNSINEQITGFARHSPVADEADIFRNGLYAFERTVSANTIESAQTNDGSPGRIWTLIMSDIMCGGHLRWSGAVTTKGIQEPIAEGDNVEYDGGLYQLEGVTHIYQITPDGRKMWETSLTLSHGLSTLTDSNEAGDNVYLTSEYSLDGEPIPAGPGLSVEDRG